MNKEEFRKMERVYNTWLQRHPKGGQNYKSFSHMRRSLEFAKYYHAIQVKNNGVSHIIKSLEELVQVKEYKEKHGKDDQYEVAKEEAWKNAKNLLNTYYS